MNRRADFIIPECYVDTNLVETLICTAGCRNGKEFVYLYFEFVNVGISLSWPSGDHISS